MSIETIRSNRQHADASRSCLEDDEKEFRANSYLQAVAKRFTDAVAMFEIQQTQDPTIRNPDASGILARRTVSASSTETTQNLYPIS